MASAVTMHKTDIISFCAFPDEVTESDIRDFAHKIDLLADRDFTPDLLMKVYSASADVRRNLPTGCETDILLKKVIERMADIFNEDVMSGISS